MSPQSRPIPLCLVVRLSLVNCETPGKGPLSCPELKTRLLKTSPKWQGGGGIVAFPSKHGVKAKAVAVGEVVVDVVGEVVVVVVVAGTIVVELIELFFVDALLPVLVAVEE
jgi:hypothetical protein